MYLFNNEKEKPREIFHKKRWNGFGQNVGM